MLVPLTLAEADASRHGRGRRRRDVVVDDAHRSPDEIVTIVRTVDPEGLGQPGRTRAELGVAPSPQTSGAHHLDPDEWRTGSQEDRRRDPRLTRDDVRAPMHAVGEV